MPKYVQAIGLIGGDAASFVGVERQWIIDLTKQTFRILDGTTPGGVVQAREDLTTSPNATATVAGKMTPAQVQQLSANADGVALNARKLFEVLEINIPDIDYTVQEGEADYYSYEFTGTLTQDRVVTFPDTPQRYAIFNNTTGDFNLQFQTVTQQAPTNLRPGYNDVLVHKDNGAFEISQPLSAQNNLSDVGNALTARQNLGVIFNTDVGVPDDLKVLGPADIGQLQKVSASAGNRTITLGAVATLGIGWYIPIKKQDSTANTVTVALTDGNIDGASEFILTRPNQNVVIYCTGSSFMVMSNYVDALTQGLHIREIPAGAFKPEITDGASFPTYEERTDNNVIQEYVEYADGVTQYAQADMSIPPSVDATKDLSGYVHLGISTGSAGAAYLTIQGQYQASGSNTSMPWSAPIVITPTLNQYLLGIAAFSGLTLPGAPSSRPGRLKLRIGREGAHTSDTLAVPMRLYGIDVALTVDKANDE